MDIMYIWIYWEYRGHIGYRGDVGIQLDIFGDIWLSGDIGVASGEMLIYWENWRYGVISW